LEEVVFKDDPSAKRINYEPLQMSFVCFYTGGVEEDSRLNTAIASWHMVYIYEEYSSSGA